MKKEHVRRFTLGMVLAVVMLPGAVPALSIDDFVLSDDAGLSPSAYFGFTLITANGDTTGIDLGLAVSFGTVDGLEGMFFEFVNASTSPNNLTSIKSIYFGTEDLLAAGAYAEGTAGVNFAIGGNGNGNKGFPFDRNSALDAEASSPPPTNGINPGESLLVGYALAGDPVDLLEGLTSGDWGLGLHIISTGGDGEDSEKYIATFLPNGPLDPGNPVPEPASVVLLGLGTAFLAARARLRVH